jgi:hypothetical protein
MAPWECHLNSEYLQTKCNIAAQPNRSTLKNVRIKVADVTSVYYQTFRYFYFYDFLHLRLQATKQQNAAGLELFFFIVLCCTIVFCNPQRSSDKHVNFYQYFPAFPRSFHIGILYNFGLPIIHLSSVRCLTCFLHNKLHHYWIRILWYLTLKNLNSFSFLKKRFIL